MRTEPQFLLQWPPMEAATATNQPQKSKKIRLYVALHGKLAYLCKKISSDIKTTSLSQTIAAMTLLALPAFGYAQDSGEGIETVDGGNPAKQHNSTFLVTLGYNFNM